MSYITHACQTCGHVREAHEPHSRSFLSYTSCSCTRFVPEETPVIRDTWSLPGMGHSPAKPPTRDERLQPLTVPGEPIYLFPTVRSCDCDECQTAYAQNVDRYPKGA